MVNDVTIGIPLFNSEKYISHALGSALSQTYPYIDFLVIDDGCEDGSVDIVMKLQEQHPRGKNIRLIRHNNNRGIGETRNHLIDETQTKYLFFLDSDDYIEDNAIQMLHDEAVRHNAEMVYGSHIRVDLFDDRQIETPNIYTNNSFFNQEEFAAFAYRKYEGIQAPIWNILLDVDWLRQSKLRFLPINFWEDFVLTMDVPFYASRVIFLPSITYHYIRHPKPNKMNLDRSVPKEEVIQVINAIDYLKAKSSLYINMPFFPERMIKIMKTDVFIVCNIIKKRKMIFPTFSKHELSDILKSPLSLKEVLNLKGKIIDNLSFYILGVIHPCFSLAMIFLWGKRKGLI